MYFESESGTRRLGHHLPPRLGVDCAGTIPLRLLRGRISRALLTFIRGRHLEPPEDRRGSGQLHRVPSCDPGLPLWEELTGCAVLLPNAGGRRRMI